MGVSEMAKFRKERLNPLEVMNLQYGITRIPHVVFDPSLKRGDAQYCIARQQSHDGTQMFTCWMFDEVLINLINAKSCYAKDMPDKNRKLIWIKYRIGYLSLATVYGRVKLKGGTYPGQSERMRLPVICEYVYEDEGN